MFPIYILILKQVWMQLILGDEGIRDALHTILRADQYDAGASAHHQTETSWIFRKLVGLI